MNWPADASNWMDVLDHAMVIVGAIVLAGVPSWFAARNHSAIKKVGEQTTAVVGQVVNGHADQPPLRVDIDRVNKSLESVAKDIHGIKQDLADERAARRDVVADLRDDITRHREETTNRLDALRRHLEDKTDH